MRYPDITQVSPKDKPWDTHKAENAQIGYLYGKNARYIKYSQRMGDCSDWLEFAETTDHDKRLKLTRATFCHVRHCPICTWRKALARIARFMRNLPDYLMACPDYVYLYVVLTTRNCEMDDLRPTIRVQNDGVKKLLKRLGRAGVKVHGYIRTNEVTKGRDGLPHPHVNLILAVSKSYFSGAHYLPKMRWVELWRECMGLDYDPSVHVSKVRARKRKTKAADATVTDDLTHGILEVSKYAVKPADMVDDANFLYGITAQCHKLRFISTGGCLKDIFKDGAGRDAEDISDDEMMLPGGEETDDKAASRWRQIYLWQRERRGYLLRLRRKAAADPLVDGLEFRLALTDAMRERDAERRKKPRTGAGSAEARI